MEEQVLRTETTPDEVVVVRELGDAACKELLASHDVGRLAFVAEGYPVVLPVNYVYAEGRIWIRTDHGVKLDHAPMSAVAVEIDELRPESRTGWSVLARGVARWATAEDLQVQPHLRPWISGALPALIVVKVRHLSGRRIERS